METSALKEAGLTPGEIKVYIALLKLGPSTTGPIIEKSHVAKSIIYQILDKLTTKGFAFNVLTTYSDESKMKENLYYADPTQLFEYCKKNISNFVMLRHDYPLYEFTIIIRKGL